MQTGSEGWDEYVEQGRLADIEESTRMRNERFGETYVTGSDIREALQTTEGIAVRHPWDREVDLGGILAQADRSGD